jgi:hypothetical protein
VHLPPQTTIAYRLESYALSGAWKVIQFDPAAVRWGIEFARLRLYTHAGGTELYDPGPGSPRLEFQGGIGHRFSRAVVHVPPGRLIRYRLENYSVSGPWQQRSFDAGATVADEDLYQGSGANINDDTWDLAFCPLMLVLHAEGIMLPAGGPDNARLEFQGGIGHHGSGALLYLPPGAPITYRLESYGVSGGWQQATFDRDAIMLSAHYAKVTLFLHQDGVELAPGTLGYPRIEAQGGIGHRGTQDTIHLPPGVVITYRLEWGSLTWPWLKRSFSAGSLVADEDIDPGPGGNINDHKWDLEFIP